MRTQPTCGQGLAETSMIPAKISELIGALTTNLEVHMKALDLSDVRSRKENDAYRQLAKAYRRIAGELHATAAEMASYHDLPMGPHDQQAMTSPEAREAFLQYVNLEEELTDLIQRRLDRDHQMLGAMAGAGR